MTPTPPITLPQPTPVVPDTEYIEVDTTARVLRVCKGSSLIREFPHLRLGTSRAGIKKRRGDGITPLGNFTVGWITHVTKFRVFIGLNYPSFDDAMRGLSEGIINQQDFERIKKAIEKHARPPQDTPLGGMIGIHGLGKGDPEIHRLVNWTDGCIALDNYQIKQLAKLTYTGMPVNVYERVEGRCLNLPP